MQEGGGVGVTKPPAGFALPVCQNEDADFALLELGWQSNSELALFAEVKCEAAKAMSHPEALCRLTVGD